MPNGAKTLKSGAKLQRRGDTDKNIFAAASLTDASGSEWLRGGCVGKSLSPATSHQLDHLILIGCDDPGQTAGQQHANHLRRGDRDTSLVHCVCAQLQNIWIKTIIIQNTFKEKVAQERMGLLIFSDKTIKYVWLLLVIPTAFCLFFFFF